MIFFFHIDNIIFFCFRNFWGNLNMVKMIFLFILTISFSVCVGREILDGVSSSTNGGNITGTFIGFQKLDIPNDLI